MVINKIKKVRFNVWFFGLCFEHKPSSAIEILSLHIEHPHFFFCFLLSIKSYNRHQTSFHVSSLQKDRTCIPHKSRALNSYIESHHWLHLVFSFLFEHFRKSFFTYECGTVTMENINFVLWQNLKKFLYLTFAKHYHFMYANADR